ncbi:iron ABC transporter permease [Notoacmeibacter sp. MSK16QG-6]|uniref:ABC transporter permease n=1 Tax=Notoacmeibacter sp. MSK16QG-6 TaxID=2957982 RepID=UPI00209D4E2A|nr:iron ABC transporter permease [Notoacmeibacter sp. MSK16QG-6]MCP1200022.1 iron ABC transporter permease [Notoacmeibacter sp. MSK16QG-6]
MNRFLPWGLLSLLALAFLLLFIAYPIIGILLRSFIDESGEFSLEGFFIFLNQGRYLEALANSIILGLSVTFCCTVVGVFLAFIVARFDIPFSNIVFLLPLSVLIIPELISAQSWIMVFGNNGLVTHLLDAFGIPFPRFYGWFGLIYVMTLTYYVHIFLAALAALRGFDHSLEEAGQSLGTAPLTTYVKVVFPTIIPAVLSAGLIVFTLVVGNFAIAISLGQRVPLLSVLTYRSFISELGGNPTMQSTLATVSILLVALVLFLQRWYISKRDYQMVAGRTPPRSKLKGWKSWAATGVAGLVIVLSLLPALVVLAGSFTVSRGPVMYWGQFTLDNYTRILDFNLGVVGNSLKFASLATLLGVTFATLVSYLLVKKRSALSSTLDYLLLLPLTISGTVLGISLAQGFNSGPMVLTGTAALMVLAMMLRRLPFGVRNASSNLHNISNSLEEASVSLGVPPGRTFFNVVLPLMAPGIAAAAILTWVTTVAELSASVVIYQAGQETLPIQIFRLINSDLMARASAFGVINMVIILVPVFIGIRVMKVKLFSS